MVQVQQLRTPLPQKVSDLSSWYLSGLGVNGELSRMQPHRWMLTTLCQCGQRVRLSFAAVCFFGAVPCPKHRSRLVLAGLRLLLL